MVGEVVLGVCVQVWGFRGVKLVSQLSNMRKSSFEEGAPTEVCLNIDDVALLKTINLVSTCLFVVKFQQ